MKSLVVGILAHVDAGKTTLSEAMLYTSGVIRSLGRVDNKNAFLDHNEIERERGITIFSKQAILSLKTMQVTLLDTPGHVDFSAEMERSLQVMDAAILVISGADGVQSHTKTLWKLLKKYRIPVFLFVNKMDQPTADKEKLIKELSTKLAHGCVDFTIRSDESFYENVAICDEELLERFIENGKIEVDDIRYLIAKRKLFPCYFGSALKTQGVQELLSGLETYLEQKAYPDSFGARVYKIARDSQGNRLTYLKITGGTLNVKDMIMGEKVNQIRVYSGEKYTTIQSALAGTVCAVTGLNSTYPGQGLGIETKEVLPLLEPVLSYKVECDDSIDAHQLLTKLQVLEEEEPMLHVTYSEETAEVSVGLMGEVQIDIIKRLMKERFHTNITFSQGAIVYKETIGNSVEGIGHFEPLRHYAEVHLLLEPGKRNSGVVVESKCSEDILDKNWQKTILACLLKEHLVGVLTGSELTDIKITLLSGRAHPKHTEGGDFRQATLRALRQGLMKAESILLEPVYEYQLILPENAVGTAMNDIDQMHGSSILEQNATGTSILTGVTPVITMRGYASKVAAYTKGLGSFSCLVKGYDLCHNTEEIIKQISYNPEADLNHPTASVFCAHGAGFIVPWNQVEEYMHVPPTLPQEKTQDIEPIGLKTEHKEQAGEYSIDLEEIDAILNRTFYSNRKTNFTAHKGISADRKRMQQRKRELGPVVYGYKPKPEKKEEYLIIDGYNVIFAWKELKELAQINIDGARGSLMDVLCSYQAIKGCHVIVVFDAYRVQGHKTEILDYHNIHVVYTKEAETADQYIEHFAHENGKKYDICVVTSDGLEQIIIRGQGCRLVSSREFEKEIEQTLNDFRTKYQL